MAPQYLTPAEVAEVLRVTPEAVQTWCRARRLQAIRAGRRWLITQEAVDQFTGREVEEKTLHNGLMGITH